MAVVLPNVPVDVVYAHFEGTASELGAVAFVEAKLEYAVLKLAAKFGSRIKTRLDDGSLPVGLYNAVVAEAVLRVLRNPEGYYREEQGNYSYSLNSRVSSGYLMFTSENLADLLGESVNGSSVVGSFRVRGWRD